MSPTVEEADALLHPCGAEAHGSSLTHTWQSLCRFGKIMCHHTTVLTSAAHPGQTGTEHGGVNDLLKEIKHTDG